MAYTSHQFHSGAAIFFIKFYLIDLQ